MDKILLINDEKTNFDLVESCLTKNCFQCEKAGCMDSALKILDENNHSLTVVDIHSDNNEVWDVCKKIRELSDVPIIVVSSCGNTDCIVRGLELGADDYVTRPFAQEELLARIKAVLRRTQPRKRIDIGGLFWDKECFKLTFDNIPIKLTPIEFNLLGQFMQHSNQVFCREQLIELIWGSTSDTDSRTVDSHVQNIREKLRRTGFPVDSYLKTVWGVGYQWVSVS